MSSSGMWRCVDLALTDVSDESIASIFRVGKSASEERAWAGGTRQIFGFLKRRGIFRLSVRPLDSQGEHCSMELVTPSEVMKSAMRGRAIVNYDWGGI
jgi:hypothetical protein